MKNSVVQDWLSDCTLKQQTVVLTAIRGCDGVNKEHPSKNCVRYLRSVVLKNAATINTKFMVASESIWDDVLEFRHHLDECPIHFVLHFMHAAEIIGYYHPDFKIRSLWKDTYDLFVSAMHLTPETKSECEYRLRDGVDSD